MTPVKYMSVEMGFAPDADPAAPGVVPYCFNFIPTNRGMAALSNPLPNAADTVLAATFTSEAIVAVQSEYTGEVPGWFEEYVGTFGKIWHRSYTGVYTDVSRTAGYTVVNLSSWDFERFGNYMIAAPGVQDGGGNFRGNSVLQAGSFPGGQLTDIVGSPTCCVVTSAERFMLAFNGRDGFTDSWSCSARDDHTSWTASPSTLANTGRLVDEPGSIMCAIPFGNEVIAFKMRSMFRGQYVAGDAEVWKWQKLPFSVGCIGPRAATKLPDGRIAFIGTDSCYIYDGASVVDVLAGRAKDFFYVVADLWTSLFYKPVVVYDAQRSLLWFGFKGIGYTGMYTIVMHVATGRLGHCVIPADVIYSTGTTDTPGVRGVGFYDITESRRWFFPRSSTIPDNTRLGWSGLQQPFLWMGDFGDPYNLVTLNSARIDYVNTVPMTEPPSVVDLYRDARPYVNVLGTAGTVAPDTNERFDFRLTAHWHRLQLGVTDGFELAGAWYELTNAPTGRRT